MVNNLLAEKGDRVETFLASHENIQWIRNVENGEYGKALRILKSMSSQETDPKKKLVCSKFYYLK